MVTYICFGRTEKKHRDVYSLGARHMGNPAEDDGDTKQHETTSTKTRLRRVTLSDRDALRSKRERGVSFPSGPSAQAPGRRAQKRPSAEAHVVLVTASCARKPAAAIMPSRACASSFSCEGESEGQARARARARRAAEARVERGLRGEGREARAEGRGAWGHTCIRRNSAGSSGAKPAGSKPIWPGLYPGQSK